MTESTVGVPEPSPALANACAASSVNPPTKTARRRKSAFSSGDSRSYDHAMASRMVRCRWGASRGPDSRSGSRRSSWASNADGWSSLIWAAASSIASGNPSSRAQIRTTSSRFSSVSAKSDRTATARATKRRTASESGGSRRGEWVGASGCRSLARDVGAGKESGGTGITRSPETCSGVRLVASTFRLGQAPRRLGMIAAAAATCSKLSSTSKALAPARWLCMR